MDRKQGTKQGRLRLGVQMIFAALTNGYVAGFLQGKIYQGTSKQLCLPGLNCYSCPGALGACPIGSLQAVLSSRNYGFSFYIVGFFLIIGALVGRLVCGWLCPFGLVQDLLHRIPLGKKRKKLPGHGWLRWLKYGVLGILVILLPLFVVDEVGQGSPWFCEYLCPSGTLFGGWPLLLVNEGLRSVAGWLFAWKNLILVALILLSVAVYRPFCQYFCPLGAVYSWFNKISLYRYQVDLKSCVNCGICQKSCPLDLPVFQIPNSGECIRCGKCKAVCPTGAIQSRFFPGNNEIIKGSPLERM